MKTSITVIIALVLVLMTIIGIYTATSTVVTQGAGNAYDTSESFSDSLNCAITGGSADECDDFSGGDDD